MLSLVKWLSLSLEMRAKLVEKFQIQRSGFTHVENQIVVSDGYSSKDLLAISLEKLQQFVGSKSTDFYELFDQAVILLDNPVPKKKLGRPPTVKVVQA